MKYCPICQTRYDEEIMRFCTKDGTPLIEEEEPNFVEMPSESLDAAEDDPSEETVVRRKAPASEAFPDQPGERDSQRLVVPVAEEAEIQPGQAVQARAAAYGQKPQKSNTALVVLITMLGTIIVLGGALGAYLLLSGQKDEPDTNTNLAINSNQDTNLNTNITIDNSLFNINAETNFNANANANANIKTPTPTPSPTPTRTPTPTPTPDENEDNTNANANANANTTNSTTPANTRPTVTPTPRATPSAPPSNTPVNVGNLNNRAISLLKPPYPAAAKALRASGQVVVQVLVDESGRVLSANAVSGHPLLRQAAENAARQSRFNPVRVSGQPVKTIGTIVYNFVDN